MASNDCILHVNISLTVLCNVYIYIYVHNMYIICDVYVHLALICKIHEDTNIKILKNQHEHGSIPILTIFGGITMH